MNKKQKKEIYKLIKKILMQLFLNKMKIIINSDKKYSLIKKDHNNKSFKFLYISYYNNKNPIQYFYYFDTETDILRNIINIPCYSNNYLNISIRKCKKMNEIGTFEYFKIRKNILLKLFNVENDFNKSKHELEKVLFQIIS